MPSSNSNSNRESLPDYFLLPREPLIEIGNSLGVQSLKTGAPHPVLQAMASRHAQYQASVGKQGHQHFASRVQELYRDMPDCHEFSEVAAESWPDQDEMTAAMDAYRSWKASDGHWAAVNGACAFYGYAMCYRPKNRIWYSCGLFAQLR